jgi:hypothetical protein
MANDDDVTNISQWSNGLTYTRDGKTWDVRIASRVEMDNPGHG